MNIWKTFKQPIFALAPMEDVTDTVFRQIIMKCGRPDVFFTEFTNVEGLSSQGNTVVSQRLRFTSQEQPLIAQIWGKDPKHYFEVAKQLVTLGFNGIDINMGCPQKVVIKTGSCAALMKNTQLAHEIILATQEGAKTHDPTFPVSVKTRIGYNAIATDEWISFLLSHQLEALTIHGRTAKEMSKVPAHWEEIGKAVQLRNSISPSTIILGNGDIASHAEALEKVTTFGVDGVMIGRGVFKNPFIFSPSVNRETIPPRQMIELLTTHLAIWEKTWGDTKHYPILKKYFKIYVSGFDGAGELREKLMLTRSPDEARQILFSMRIL